MFKKLTDISDIKNYEDAYVLVKDQYNFTLYRKNNNYIYEVATLSTSFSEFGICDDEYEKHPSTSDVYDVNFDMDDLICEFNGGDVVIMDAEEHFLDKLRTIISMCLNPVINDINLLVGTPCADKMLSGRYYIIHENDRFRFIHTNYPKNYNLFEMYEPETVIPITNIAGTGWIEFRRIIHTTLNLNGSVQRWTTIKDGYIINHWEMDVIEITKDVYEKAKTMRNKLYNNVLELFNKYVFISEED